MLRFNKNLTSSRIFFLLLSVLCLLYLGFEWYFNANIMFGVDEFWFAHRALRFQHELPYRDFAPYKTVAGYYFLLVPQLWQPSSWMSLITIKNCIAIFNVSFLCACTIWLKQRLNAITALASLSLLISTETLLFYSTNIRVDLFGYWFGLLALLCLIESRGILAGLLLGIAFAFTQKIFWYFLASNVALGSWFLLERNADNFKLLLRYNSAFFITVLFYLSTAAAISSWHTVLNNVFIEAGAMYQLAWYDSAREAFWQYILVHNPFVFLLWPLTPVCLMLSSKQDASFRLRWIVVVFGLVLLSALSLYRQVFPYYMQVTTPYFLVLYATFFYWLYALFTETEQTLQVKRGFIQAYLSAYIAALIGIVSWLNLPIAYLFIATIPLLLAARLQQKNTLYPQLLVLTLFITGIIYPWVLVPALLTQLNGAYQQANLNLAGALLLDGSDYVAGIDLLPNHSQPIPGLKHLMGPAIDYLSSHDPKLKPVMLASLDEDPNANNASVIAALKQSRVKFYINNYRIMGLAPELKQYLHQEYTHFWGSIYLYAPVIETSQDVLNLRFSGYYWLTSLKPNSMLTLNGKTYQPHTVIKLLKGHYLVKANGKMRLKLLPQQSLNLNTQFAEDEWQKILE